MTRPKPSIASSILLLPTGITLFLYGYLGSFTRLLADDFCSAYYAGRLGLLRSIWYWYINWSGRYSAYAADWLVEKIGVYSLSVIPPLSLLLWLILTVIAVYKALPGGKSLVIAVTLSAIFLFVVLALSPSIPQSLYWWNGMRAYSLPLMMLTLYAVLFQVGVERLKSAKQVMAGILASFLLAFAIGGFSETCAAFQVALLGYFLIVEWFVRGRDSAPFRFLLAGWIGSIVALAIVVLAPGNTVRQDYYSPHPGLGALLQISLTAYGVFLLDILRTPEKMTGVIGALLAAVWFGTQRRDKPTGNDRFLPLVFTGAFLVSFATFLPSAYAVSDAPAPRSVIIPVFVLIACLLCAGFIAGEWLSEGSRLLVNILLLLAIAFITYSAWIGSQALYTSRREYIEFAQKWDETDTLILKAKAANLETVQIPAMDNWAGLERPTPKETYWPNVCYSLYYDIQVLGPRYPD